LQQQANVKGTSRLSLEEIEAEIADVRSKKPSDRP
jgi:hypothetical protein